MTKLRTGIARRIPKATNTHSQYVLFYPFPPRQWKHEGVSMSRHKQVGWFVYVTNVSRKKKENRR